ncbi:MAG: DUF5706 domain-containing protein [Hylemonella sp.]|nr:DUF5706 domain-containing protein [Hylemonella sp.]
MNAPVAAETPQQGVAMTDAERLAECKWIFERQLQWSAATEVKVGVVATIELAMVAGLGAIYMEAHQRSSWIVGSSMAFGICAVVTLFCAGMVLMPRVKGPSRSLVFFARIAALSAADYITRLAATQHRDLLQDLSAQTHRNAEIACDKHWWVGRATMIAFLSALPWFVAVGLLAS